MTTKKIVLLAATFVAAVVVWEALTSHPTGAGDLAPLFDASALDGRRIALADYRGRSAVLLNFFSNH